MRELVVVDLAGSKYGVWKEDVVTLRDVGVVHRLPERMEWFSGVSAIDNRIVQLFDLSVCLGHSPFNNSGSGLALIMSKGGVPKGFVADGGGTAEVEDSDIFPLPAHLSCPEFDACVFRNGELIPVVKIGKLYKSICGSSWTPPVFTLEDTVPDTDADKTDSLRMFTVSGRIFAIDNDLIENAGVIPGHMHILPTAPGHVDGIICENGKLRAVVNTGHYMGSNGSVRPDTTLFVKDGPAILVESDLGVRKAGPLIPLPSLASLELLQHAVMHEKEIIPIINVHALMSRQSKEYTGKKYVPRSKFHTFFKKKEVKVLEFSIAGMIQSIPDSQVEDIVNMRAFRPLPEMHPLLQGVSEHEGELLPVLDIALCFGRRTQIRADAKMILMKNGNFRALILTEDIPVRRLLQPREHKDVPVNLPHRYLYGCYIDENIVRLILDIETIAVCSRNYAVSEDFNNLTKAMADSGLIKKKEQSRDSGKKIKTKSRPAAATAKLEKYTGSVMYSEIATGKDSESAHDTVDGESGKEETGLDLGENRDAAGEQVDEVDGLEGESGEGIETAEVEANGLEGESEEEVGKAEKEADGLEGESGEGVETAEVEANGLEGESEEEVETAEEELGVKVGAPEGEVVVNLEVEKTKAGIEVDGSKNPKQVLSQMKGRLTAGISGLTNSLQEVLNRTERHLLERPVDKDERKRLSSLITDMFEGKIRGAWLILIVLCISLIVYFAMQYPRYFHKRAEETVVEGTRSSYMSEGEETVSGEYPEGKMHSGARKSGKTGEEERKAASAGQETSSGRVEETTVFVKPGKTEGEERKIAAAETELTGRVKESPVFQTPETEYKESTLLLMEVEKKSGGIFLSTDFAPLIGANVYMVKKGDTLWHIASRFTGNPFNYHYIAEDSEIKNPDLIFPGQKIIVRIRDEK